MSLKQITLIKNKNIFCNYEARSKQNKRIAENVHSVQKKKNQTGKHDWKRFL